MTREEWAKWLDLGGDVPYAWRKGLAALLREEPEREPLTCGDTARWRDLYDRAGVQERDNMICDLWVGVRPEVPESAEKRALRERIEAGERITHFELSQECRNWMRAQLDCMRAQLEAMK